MTWRVGNRQQPDEGCLAANASAERVLENIRAIDSRATGVILFVLRDMPGNGVGISPHTAGEVLSPGELVQILSLMAQET